MFSTSYAKQSAKDKFNGPHFELCNLFLAMYQNPVKWISRDPKDCESIEMQRSY